MYGKFLHWCTSKSHLSFLFGKRTAKIEISWRIIKDLICIFMLKISTFFMIFTYILSKVLILDLCKPE